MERPSESKSKSKNKTEPVVVKHLDKTVKSWEEARRRARSVKVNDKTVIAVYRRGKVEDDDGARLFLWRQELNGTGEETGTRLPAGVNDGYELFRVPKNLIPEDASNRLRNAVIRAMNGPGGGGPVSDGGPR